MDVNISDVFETRRGKKCVAINSYKFSEFRENKDTTKIFRCTDRKCTVTAKFLITNDDFIILFIEGKWKVEENGQKLFLFFGGKWLRPYVPKRVIFLDI